MACMSSVNFMVIPPYPANCGAFPRLSATEPKNKNADVTTGNVGVFHTI
jgi:hypothetical protein